MGTATLDLTSAEEASSRLGISRASLYAYVSRGLIRSFSSPHDPRQRLYALDDVEALLERKARFRRPAVAAATALDWGLPVLETSITQIRDGRLFYRGQDAVALARAATLEDVARLLIGALDREAFHRPSRIPAPPARPAFGPHAFVAQAVRLLSEPAARETRAAEVAAILRLVTMAGSGADPAAEPLHRHLAQAWAVPPQAAEAIRRALVLCADHELSSSAFAVRVTASTGASLRNAVIAGLAALSGPYHGGMTERVRAFLNAPTTMPPPGFRHRLYPDGDPRARALLENVPLLASDATTLRALADASGGSHRASDPKVESTFGTHPMLNSLSSASFSAENRDHFSARCASIDVALVMMERAYGLPVGAAFTLFAIGRTAGWLAHAIEQRGQMALIRPRARYVAAQEKHSS
ncbi:citrate synthase family protein [Microvirga splendida]|uniref:citrate synthase (unknown stereospecificity) n=1 Tax=Microvirga splendida TaxID=2795727 RepID=A0ABS0XWT0_9HYPH|nr:citrate synthase family protein [Microvirga splendida]MBJ6124203.1 citrate synthase family protein [Microvirga splendida]